VVVAPAGWTAAADAPPTGAFPFETRRLVPPGERNAVCMISVLGQDSPKFSQAPMLRTLLKGDCRPYLGSPDEAAKVEIKALAIAGGLGFHADFVDPDLVGKPVVKGTYKTVTPIILSIGTRYLIKATILCDEIGGADYREAIALIESIAIRKE
jgi:hypothetical protein